MTPHMIDQLAMTSSAEPTDKGDELIINTPPATRSGSEPPEVEMEAVTLEGELGLLAFPKTTHPEAVLHTPAGSKWLTEEQLAALRPDLGEWDPSRRELQLIDFAEEGAYDDMAEEAGVGGPLSYILSQIQKARTKRSARRKGQGYWERKDNRQAGRRVVPE